MSTQTENRCFRCRAGREAGRGCGSEFVWKRIKTAPRDGQNLLLRFGLDGVSQGKFVPGLPHPWKFLDTNDGITWMINHAVDGPGGPSHWMPINPAPAQQPLSEREIELIDGMIEVQLDHGAYCDTILSRPNGNHQMAEKQKGWDMERVTLLRKLKAAHGIGGEK